METRRKRKLSIFCDQPQMIKLGRANNVLIVKSNITYETRLECLLLQIILY